MKKKTLLILLIVAVVGMLFVVAYSIMDLHFQVTYVYLLRDVVSEYMKEEIVFLVLAVLNTIFCLVLVGIFVTLLVVLFKREKLTLTEQERAERKELKIKQKSNKTKRRKAEKIISLTQKIEKLQQKGDK